jgi:general secretion pathway protein E
MAARLTRLPYPFARANGILLTGVGATAADVIVRASAGGEALAELKRELGMALRVEAVSDAEFDQRIAAFYATAHAPGEAGAELAGDPELARLAAELVGAQDGSVDLLAANDDAPVVRFINGVLTRALAERASDVHIEAAEARTVVRFRVDGRLREAFAAQAALHSALVSRIKVMASLDIAEKRLPQDGRIRLKLAGRAIDVRLSTLPSAYGERVVMRLLDRTTGRLDLEQLGMSDPAREQVDRLVRASQGIVLVTGPTGSGKTTSLYAALDRIDMLGLNVMTVEDPIEYDLAGISQTQANTRIGLTFARALRSILRQDPDVIMIGEIRDMETAQVAIQASLTGHLVLATLHTGDAVSSVTRLLDMGIEPYLLASSLLGVIAQRLVRRVCTECARFERPSAAEWRAIGSTAEPPDTVARIVGCSACGHTGYRGRTGIYEVLLMDETLRRLVHESAAEADLRAAARKAGAQSLRTDGLRWVTSRTTTIEELLRATAE